MRTSDVYSEPPGSFYFFQLTFYIYIIYTVFNFCTSNKEFLYRRFFGKKNELFFIKDSPVDTKILIQNQADGKI